MKLWHQDMWARTTKGNPIKHGEGGEKLVDAELLVLWVQSVRVHPITGQN